MDERARIGKEELRQKIEEYKKLGYVTKRLEGILDQDIVSIEKELANFDADVKKLKSFSERFKEKKMIELEKTFGKEISSIKSKLNDPDAVSQITREIFELSMKIKTMAFKRKEELPGEIIEKEKLIVRITDLEKEVKKLEENDIDVSSEKNIIKYAKTYMKRKNFDKALRHIKKAEKMIEEKRAKNL